RDFVRFLALIENEAEFFFAVREVGAGSARHAQQSMEKKIRRFVQEPDGGFENKIEPGQRPNEPHRHRQRIGNGGVFWRELAEDDVEKGDTEERERDRHRSDERMRMNAGVNEDRLEQMREELFADPAESEAGQGDAELRGG